MLRVFMFNRPTNLEPGNAIDAEDGQQVGLYANIVETPSDL